MFAVTGVTGEVRGVVARVLLAAGLDARGVVRDPVEGEDSANGPYQCPSLWFTPVQGDLNVASLAILIIID
ncbi:NmrA family protein [Caballeronia udeis]|uniref:NmrA family protein n=1 Tax=Caballeronia udeis TaxID=1232866 RepID=A0A158GBS0_9BURK|nr:NmrA family protein [Caballeronia udeis]